MFPSEYKLAFVFFPSVPLRSCPCQVKGFTSLGSWTLLQHPPKCLLQCPAPPRFAFLHYATAKETWWKGLEIGGCGWDTWAPVGPVLLTRGATVDKPQLQGGCMGAWCSGDPTVGYLRSQSGMALTAALAPATLRAVPSASDGGPARHCWKTEKPAISGRGGPARPLPGCQAFPS